MADQALGDQREALREANAAFYGAVEELDLAAMERVWLHESWVRCIHPGWDLLVGWVGFVTDYDPATHIMETGRELLAGQPADFGAALAIALGMIALLGLFAVRGLRKAEAAG